MNPVLRPIAIVAEQQARQSEVAAAARPGAQKLAPAAMPFPGTLHNQ